MLTSTSIYLDFGHVYGDLNGDKLMKDKYGVKQSSSNYSTIKWGFQEKRWQIPIDHHTSTGILTLLPSSFSAIASWTSSLIFSFELGLISLIFGPTETEILSSVTKLVNFTLMIKSGQQIIFCSDTKTFEDKIITKRKLQ